LLSVDELVTEVDELLVLEVLVVLVLEVVDSV
jgi:hypothetical protein